MENLSQIIESKNFLGKEFLLWLWKSSESKQSNQIIHSNLLGRKIQFNYWLDNKIVFDKSATCLEENAIKGGDPANSLEACLLLMKKKPIKEIKIGIQVEEIGDFFFTLESKSASIRSLILPPESSSSTIEDDPELHNISKRVESLEIFYEIFQQLYSQFCSQRIGENWENHDLKEIQTWMLSKQHKFESTAKH